MQPLISVVIPTYNRSHAIRSTVESVLHQDLEPEQVELIIVDDGSTDDTFAFLESTYANEPRIRLIRQENAGVAAARNRGLEEARGEYIAYLDHDDLWLPDKLRLQLEKIKDNPKVGVVYCNWVSVDQSGQEMPHVIQFQRHWWWHPAEGRVFPWTMLPHFMEFLRNPIVSMSIPLLRTQSVRELGGFDPDLVPSDDWDLWIRLSQIVEFAYVNKVLVHYVHHQGQQHKQLQTAYISWLKICGKHPVSWKQHPWVWWKQWLVRRYCRAFMHYPDAKAALFEGNYGRLFVLMLRTAYWRPDALLSRRWLYIFYRVLTGQRKPY